MTPAPVTAFDTGQGQVVRATLAATARWLEAAGHPVELRALPRRDLPRHDREAHRLDLLFAATPESLLRSWRIARHVERATRPGDVVVLSDCRGAAGVYALEQAMRPPAEARRVIVAAGHGTALAALAIAGTIDGLGPPEVYDVDWELVAYRYADAVVTPSPAAAELLTELGCDARVAVLPDPPAPPGEPDPAGSVYLAEPVCRISRTPEMLRAFGRVLDDLPHLRAVAAEDDCQDRIWEGTTWEALAGMRASLGDAVTRGEAPPDAAWVLGDPFAQPSAAARRHRDAGGRVLVAAASAAAARWPEAETWRDETSLARALAGPARPTPESPRPAPPAALELRPHRSDPGRALRVSVGVPVYRDAGFLDECVRSLLAQDQPPHEVVLVDDGSRSAEVDEELARWERAAPGVVRTLRQPNAGVCAARNLALETMSGDSFVFVDADDMLDRRFIARCAAALRANPDVWAVATWTEFFGAYEAVEAKPPFDRRVGLRENPIVSTCVLVDMAVRDRGIRFTPDLAFLYCEDWDVWSQIVAAGGSFGLVPEPLARHRVHRASGGFRRTELASSLGKARATARLRDGS